MLPARPAELNWTQKCDELSTWVQHNVFKDFPEDKSHLIVEISGAQATTEGTSTVNHSHLAFVVGKLQNLVAAPLTGLGRNAGKPLKVLVLAGHKAQVNAYKRQ
jgi:hypothetical protein|uniref:Uncharacterized protein n=1 Tax=Bionectria ochroleuca TaxID=29856 RepID=A0A8H7NA41_BIOOC